jgi:hypothetical protein
MQNAGSTEATSRSIPVARGHGHMGVSEASHHAACGVAVPSERRLLLCSNSLAPNNRPPTARRTGRPWPIAGAGAGTPGKEVSGDVPNENCTFEIVVELVTPVRSSVKVAGPST